MTPGPILIVGAGPGIGHAVARRFGREGHSTGLVARDQTRLDELVGNLTREGVSVSAARADIRDVAGLRVALANLVRELGPPQVVLFSPHPDVNLIKPVLDTKVEDLQAAMQLNVLGPSVVVETVVPEMRERGRGTLLFTTGSAGLSPTAGRAVSGITTTAETVYVRMLHEALKPSGIHVHHAVIVGPVGHGRRHEPSVVADHLWRQFSVPGDACSELR